MDADKLVRNANQIAQFFAHEGAGQGAAKTADHLRRFWEPRMRRQIIAHLDGGGAGLHPLARAAVALLEPPAATGPGHG